MPWLSPTVYKQGVDEPLTGLPRFDDGPRQLRFRHIVHAYTDHALPANTAVQAITFDSIKEAARAAGSHLPVACVAVTYPQDGALVPAGIDLAPTLRRSVTDVAVFKIERPFPLLYDILDHGLVTPLTAPLMAGGQEADEGDYVVMTNSDIHLQPAFYQALAVLIRQGYDVITVNRRTIDAPPEARAFSPLFMVDAGKLHPGLDCFVFPRRLYRHFLRSGSCCGIGYVMRSLLFNLVAHAGRFLMVTSAHMTYHLGDDVKWQAPDFAEYQDFNIRQAEAVLDVHGRDPILSARLRPFVAAHEDARFREFIDRVPVAG